MRRRSPSNTRRYGSVVLLLIAFVALAFHLQQGGDAHAMIAARAGWRVPNPGLHAPKRLAPLPRGRVDMALGELPVHAYPPLTSVASLAAGALGVPAPAPLLIMLHGMCGQPRAACEYWSEARGDSWLLCPSGNVGCGASYDWRGSGETKARHIDAAVAALRARHGDHMALGDDILIGFSRGAFVARDVAYARPGRYRGLILIGAALEPDPERLRASGVRRVVLASGDYDGARPTMRVAAGLLNRGGVEARFVSTGKIYHQLPADLDVVIRDAVRWIRNTHDAT